MRATDPPLKMEKDIANADKTAKKEQKRLAQTAAANKAEDLASVDGSDNGEGSKNGGSAEGDEEEDNTNGDVKNITAELAKRTPEEIFKQFDTDGSGLIDFDEFRAMLPQLGINISMPKVHWLCSLCVPECIDYKFIRSLCCVHQPTKPSVAVETGSLEFWSFTRSALGSP